MLVRLTDRAIVRVAGEGATKFLHSLATQDLISAASPLKRGAAFGAFLSPQGRVLYDCLFYASKLTEEAVYVDVHESLKTKVLTQLSRHKLNLPLNIEVTDHIIGAAFPTVPGNLKAEIITQDPRWKKLPYRFLLTSGNGADIPEGTDEYHSLRIAAGVPEGPSEFLTNESLPLNMNLDLMNGVSFSKGCYVGQELTTRTMRRGVIRRRVVSLTFATDASDILPGTDVKKGEVVIGKVISAIKGNQALALVQTEAGDALNERNQAADLLSRILEVTVGPGVPAQISVPPYFRALSSE